MRSSRAARLAATAAVGIWLGCAGPPAPRDVPPPAPLVASEAMPGDFVLQQQIRYRWEGGEGTLDAALQSACGELTIVVLTPFGTRGTVIRQRGWQIDVTGGQVGQLPFAPERILLDVQRTYLPEPPNPPRVGSRERHVGDQRVEETWEDGRLIERVFHPTRAGDDRVRIRYRAGAAADAPSALLESERFGYQLDITTLARSAIACELR